MNVLYCTEGTQKNFILLAPQPGFHDQIEMIERVVLKITQVQAPSYVPSPSHVPRMHVPTMYHSIHRICTTMVCMYHVHSTYSRYVGDCSNVYPRCRDHTSCRCTWYVLGPVGGYCLCMTSGGCEMHQYCRYVPRDGLLRHCKSYRFVTQLLGRMGRKCRCTVARARQHDVVLATSSAHW